jgi:hypothetical protein
MRPKVTVAIAFSALLLAALAAVPCSAQIVNGDFSAGPTGWSASVPLGWSAQFPQAGGNPAYYGRIQSPFGNSEGEGCISQTFVCADPLGCALSLDYEHATIDASQLTGRAKIYFNGELAFVSPPADVQPWTTLCFNLVTPGTYTIALCLQVDAGNNGWFAGYDNVQFTQCEGTVPLGHQNWGAVKALYRD